MVALGPGVTTASTAVCVCVYVCQGGDLAFLVGGGQVAQLMLEYRADPNTTISIALCVCVCACVSLGLPCCRVVIGCAQHSVTELGPLVACTQLGSLV